MTATLDAVATREKDKPEPTAEQKLAEELVARAREQGVALTGPDGLLKQLTKTAVRAISGRPQRAVWNLPSCPSAARSISPGRAISPNTSPCVVSK
jgi:hypothetical protein